MQPVAVHRFPAPRDQTKGRRDCWRRGAVRPGPHHDTAEPPGPLPLQTSRRGAWKRARLSGPPRARVRPSTPFPPGLPPPFWKPFLPRRLLVYRCRGSGRTSAPAAQTPWLATWGTRPPLSAPPAPAPAAATGASVEIRLSRSSAGRRAPFSPPSFPRRRPPQRHSPTRSRPPPRPDQPLRRQRSAPSPSSSCAKGQTRSRKKRRRKRGRFDSTVSAAALRCQDPRPPTPPRSEAARRPGPGRCWPAQPTLAAYPQGTMSVRRTG